MAVVRPGRGLIDSLGRGCFAQRASCGAVVARAVDAPNRWLQQTACPSRLSDPSAIRRHRAPQSATVRADYPNYERSF